MTRTMSIFALGIWAVTCSVPNIYSVPLSMTLLACSSTDSPPKEIQVKQVDQKRFVAKTYPAAETRPAAPIKDDGTSTASQVALRGDEGNEGIKATGLIPEAIVDLQLQGEESVFGFETTSGKQLYIGLDKARRYLVYRFGKKGKVEFQFPREIAGSFDRFTYKFYLRGGGPENEGLDFNYLVFEGVTHRFTVYEEYSYTPSGKEVVDVGVKVMNLKNKKEFEIKGRPATRKGTLMGFRDNDLVKMESGGV